MRYTSWRTSRRRWMQTITAAALTPAAYGGPVLPPTPLSPARGRRSVIFVFLYGGPSHLDLWDPKPQAPAEIRGELTTIDTTQPGVRFTELLPHLARQAHRLCLLRGMHHRMTNHNSAAVEALCGRQPARGDLELLNDDEESFPCHGSLVERDRRLTGATTPLGISSLALPHVMHNVVRLPGQTPGFLGPTYCPFQIESDPSAAEFRVRTIELADDLPAERFAHRRSLLERLDRPHGSEPEPAHRVSAKWEAHRARAFDLLENQALREALSISREDEAMRERYGRNKLGQSLLLARRLVEAGIEFVQVHDGVHNGQDANWDSHVKVFPRHRELVPPLDLGLSALLEDLAHRGLLDQTLVVVTGEFGRTPNINPSAGRDHWPNCYTTLLAGGNVQVGPFGASDSIGAYPATRPVTPGDLAATLYRWLGIQWDGELQDGLGRPHPIAAGAPIPILA